MGDRRLLELRAAGKSSISIAAGLKRSAKAINQRLLLLRGRKQWAHEAKPDV
jgi:hypothetical protein